MPSHLSAARPRDYAFTVALMVVALLPRLYVALAWAREPVWDGHYYHFGAERIAAGLGYSEDVVIDGHTVWKPWAHYPVGYSALLGLAYRLFGSSILTAPVLNALLGTMLVVVVHRFARYMLTDVRSRIAGTLTAIHPGLIAYSAVVMTEQLAALLLLAAGWAMVAHRRSWWAIALTGPLLGMATLVRPASLLAGPALWLVGRARPWWEALAKAAAVTILALVCIVPWTYRNCQVMDGCALVSTNGGWNLAIGALTETGRFRTLRAEDGCPVVTGQVQQDRCWAQVGLRTIERDPKGWAAKIPAKLSQTYDHESFAIEYLHEAAPDLWSEPRRVAGRELLTLFHRLLIVAAALSPIALVTSPRRRIAAVTQGVLLLATATYASYSFASPQHPFFGLVLLFPLLAALPFAGRPQAGPAGRYLYALVAVTSLTHAVFFGDDRYHMVISPALCVLAAAALRRSRSEGEAVEIIGAR